MFGPLPAFSAYYAAHWRNAVHQEYVAGHNSSMTNHCVAAENGAVGVNDDIIFDGRMALDMFDGPAVFVERKAFGSEGYALVELDVVADVAGFADDYTGSVVDKESVSMVAPGWMSIPVSEWVYSLIMRGISGTLSLYSSWQCGER